MSAYVVDERTMHRAVRGIFATMRVFADSNDGTAIGRLLFAMNADAVSQRYPDKPEMPAYGRQLARVYQYDEPTFTPVLVLFKSMVCLDYQCSEGNVPDSALFREFDRATDKLARKIIVDSPSYQKLPWE